MCVDKEKGKRIKKFDDCGDDDHHRHHDHDEWKGEENQLLSGGRNVGEWMVGVMMMIKRDPQKEKGKRESGVYVRACVRWKNWIE